MESGLPYSRRAVRTNCYVLRPNQLSCYLSNDDEHDLSKRSNPRMALGVHGRYCNTHQTKQGRNRGTTRQKTSELHTPCPRSTGKKRPLSKTRKMRVRKTRNRIPWSDSRTKLV